MKAMQDNGIRVPDDVSIIGFDDLPFCSITTPGLTTIRVFKQEMGRTAVRPAVGTGPVRRPVCHQIPDLHRVC